MLSLAETLSLLLDYVWEEGSHKIKDSYQYINYEGKKEGEIAAYVVLNFKKLMTNLERFKSI